MQPTLQSLLIFPRLKIHDLTVEPKRVKAAYLLTKPDGSEVQNELIYSYDEKIIDPKSPESINLASMMAAQLAMNYGLFCKEIIFDGLYDEADKHFISNMTENTSREVFVNKILFKNKFLLPPFDKILPEKKDRYTGARISFVNTKFEGLKTEKTFPEPDKNKFAILSSGGKDSLLTYGIVRDIGGEAHPVFINESGRHWFTAINAHRYLAENEPNTGRVWCNSDRIFNWMLRQMPFIRQDFVNVRADYYPLRLWTVAVYLFGVLPVARHRNIGNILIGDEYDTTLRENYQGITHYAGLYDQSKYFDKALTRYFFKKGWNTCQYSILRSLGELLIVKILVKRYPELHRHQVSCHASHEKDGRIYPCGKCEKCRRIAGMLMALGEDPGRCGYTPEQIQFCLKALEEKKVKQIGPDAAHLYHLLLEKGLISHNAHTEKLAKPHEEILKLRFDRERSNLADLPSYIREPILKIYSEYANGAVVRGNRKWREVDASFFVPDRDPSTS